MLMKLKEWEPCYYCGLLAWETEHTVPKSLINAAVISGDLDSYFEMIRGRKLVVASCIECNRLLGKRYDPSLKARKARLKTLLRVKYRKILERPRRKDSETDDLGRTLFDYVTGLNNLEQLIRYRLRW